MLNKPQKTITNFKNNWLKTNKSRYLNKDNRFKLFSSIQNNKLGSTSFNYNNLIFYNTKGFNTKRQMINLKKLKTDFINIYIKKEFITTKFFKLLFERVKFILKTNIDHSFHAKIVLDKIFKKNLQKKKFFNRYKTFSPSITRIFQTVTHSFSVFLRNKLIFFSRNSLLYLIYFMSSLNPWLICLYVNVIKYVFTERKRYFIVNFEKIRLRKFFFKEFFRLNSLIFAPIDGKFYHCFFRRFGILKIFFRKKFNLKILNWNKNWSFLLNNFNNSKFKMNTYFQTSCVSSLKNQNIFLKINKPFIFFKKYYFFILTKFFLIQEFKKSLINAKLLIVYLDNSLIKKTYKFLELYSLLISILFNVRYNGRKIFKDVNWKIFFKFEL